MARQIFSTTKPGFAIWSPSGHGLYPSGLVSALFFNEGGGVGLITGDAVTWDSLNQAQFEAQTGNIIPAPGWVQGQGGPALSFGGGGAFLYATKFTRAVDPKTWVCWIRPKAATQGTIAAKNDANTVSAGWYLNNSATIMQLVVENSSTNMIYQSDVPANWTGAWHHVAVVWDGSATADNTKIYIDGILRAKSGSTTNGSGSHGSDGGQIYRIARGLGGGSVGVAGIWSGDIESLFLFNRPLSQPEVLDLMMASYRWIEYSYAVSVAGAFTQTLDASMSTFSGAIAKQTNKPLSASMSTFDAILSAGGRFAKTLSASMSTFSGALTKQTNKVLAAGMSTFAGALTTLQTHGMTFTAGMATFSGALTKKTSRTLNAGMATWTATLNKLTSRTLTAGMATFDGALAASKLFLKTLAAAMLQMAGSITKQAGKALTAGMHTFSATLTPVFIKGGNAKTFTAGMATFAGALTFQDNKALNAGMALFSATLSLAVTHGTVPPVCAPVAPCDILPQIISHVETCENPGS